MINEEIKEKIEFYTLKNAITHNGKARTEPILNKIIAEHKELLKEREKLKEIIENIVNEINSLSLEEQRIRFEKFEIVEERKEERKGLKDIAKIGEIVRVRFAPNPDGALTLGNARPAILCDEYAKRYNGKFILRFDDTDPKIKVPEKRFYDWIIEDLKWLGIKIDEIYYQSKRLEIYYDVAEELIKLEGAYVCTCKPEKWKELRNRGEACECRNLSVKENMERWKKMKETYKEGEAVLRIKTDLNHKNFAVRDFPALRIVDSPNHPITKAKIWPLYNFASAVDDHILEITHILRGQEHATNAVKQEYIYNHLGWKYPKVFLLGRLFISDVVLSKSKIRAGIKNKEFSEWDDIRLGTLRALRRRGFSPEAIRKLILDIGLKSSDAKIAKENLEAYNKKFIDPIANRYFFVKDPVKIKVKGIKPEIKRIRLHPSIERGYKEIKVGEFLWIDGEDFEKFKGKEIRLKDLGNVILEKECSLIESENKRVQIIQWVPDEFKIDAEIVTPEKIVKGYGELNLKNLREGEIIQFERFGFVRIEEVGDKIRAIFAHR
jgi:glutamyl-tRNA synthetase